MRVFSVGIGIAALLCAGASARAQEAPCAPSLASESAVATAGSDYEAWLTRVARARQRYETFACQAQERRALAEVEGARPLTVRRTQRQPASLYTDVTLRRGDVIVTDEGFRIFTGGSLRPAAFQPIGAMRLSPQRLQLLHELERAAGFELSAPH